ncbi:MAG: fatty acid desaturase [Candidatus Thiodiazotropha sp. (ex Lucinoma annulata)]|nr:fatty acid desaturase [Candidatus Thiodiazotropha sp. (ex Lucinoma annulata)]
MSEHNQQNLLLSFAVPVVMLVLLWLGSHNDGLVFVLALLLFAFLGLTNYALIHEGCHYNLNSKREVNDKLGTLVSWLFPVSFTFMEIAHQVHHRNNRTDGEMFDYYYPDDNRLIKYAQWYSILIGIYPPIIPLGSMLMAFASPVFHLKPWRVAKSSSIIFDQHYFSPPIISKIRKEVMLGIGFWLIAWWLFDLDSVTVLIFYGAFWVNWSTRQYVSHAFSPRDVMNGAWNLKVSKLMGWIFLNGQWDLVHHKYPELPWQRLPELGSSSTKPISYWKQYFRMWAGPRPNREPAPTAIAS